MALRNVIRIDQDKCTGCGLCIPNCPEGAIQLIDGKARLVSELMCDGLGACLGHCPTGAISVEKREAQPYDERRVMENIVPQGPNTIRAHLAHLRDHGQTEYYNQAVTILKEKGIPVPVEGETMAPQTVLERPPTSSGCPGSRVMAFDAQTGATEERRTGSRPSQLTHWPIQLHLMSPSAPHYQGADVLLAADCTAFALGEFHGDFLKGRKLAIACPKLDEGQEIYVEKIRALIDEARINTLTVIMMQVPCCSRLLHLAQEAASKASRKVPIKCVVVGLQGTVMKEEWV